jgi:hypothetical protein
MYLVTLKNKYVKCDAYKCLENYMFYITYKYTSLHFVCLFCQDLGGIVFAKWELSHLSLSYIFEVITLLYASLVSVNIMYSYKSNILPHSFVTLLFYYVDVSSSSSH